MATGSVAIVGRFSRRSKNALSSCDDDLQRVFNEVVQVFDCTVLVGHRGETDQNEAFRKGRSKLRWPFGKHNRVPSYAVDARPHPFDHQALPLKFRVLAGEAEPAEVKRYLKAVNHLAYFAGWVCAVARAKGIVIRWGGDWDLDTQVADNQFDDLFHFELVR